jgi:hypothetical protein
VTLEVWRVPHSAAGLNPLLQGYTEKGRLGWPNSWEQRTILTPSSFGGGCHHHHHLLPLKKKKIEYLHSLLKITKKEIYSGSWCPLACDK